MQLDADGEYYARHVQAMTEEGLFTKSDIAGELAWRDMVIDDLKEEITLLRKQPTSQPTETCKWKRHDYLLFNPHEIGKVDLNTLCIEALSSYPCCPCCGKRIEVVE